MATNDTYEDEFEEEEIDHLAELVELQERALIEIKEQTEILKAIRGGMIVIVIVVVLVLLLSLFF